LRDEIKKKSTLKDFQVKKNPGMGDIESPRPLYPIVENYANIL
jgi:hypothetical protein